MANKISAGVIDAGVAGGVENMTMYDMMSMIDVDKIADEVFENETARNCLMGMGETSENVAEKYGITRLQQDTLSVSSHKKALHAQ